MTERWLSIGRGKAGWYASIPGCSSSGGVLEEYLKEAVEGALVWDADEANISSYVNHVINGPMLDHKLEPNESDRFTKKDRESAAHMLPGLSGGFDTIAAKAIADESWSGLDSVGIGIYEILLRKIPGIKIGRVVDGKVKWEHE